MFLDEPQAARIDAALQILGVRGVTVFGASGDGGSHFSFQAFDNYGIGKTLNEISCAFQLPCYPSDSPYLTSVGGTVWKSEIDPSSAPIAWSGSGSGFSWEFPMPSHQKNVVAAYLANTTGLPPAASFNSSGRAYPDISAVSIDGTSQSSPIVAGIFSLLLDQRLNKGLPPLGHLAPRLWAVATNFVGEAVRDVTSGNSKTSCNNGFPATHGWDPVTHYIPGRAKLALLMRCSAYRIKSPVASD